VQADADAADGPPGTAEGPGAAEGPGGAGGAGGLGGPFDVIVEDFAYLRRGFAP